MKRVFRLQKKQSNLSLTAFMLILALHPAMPCWAEMMRQMLNPLKS